MIQFPVTTVCRLKCHEASWLSSAAKTCGKQVRPLTFPCNMAVLVVLIRVLQRRSVVCAMCGVVRLVQGLDVMRGLCTRSHTASPKVWRLPKPRWASKVLHLQRWESQRLVPDDTLCGAMRRRSTQVNERTQTRFWTPCRGSKISLSALRIRVMDSFFYVSLPRFGLSRHNMDTW